MTDPEEYIYTRAKAHIVVTQMSERYGPDWSWMAPRVVQLIRSVWNDKRPVSIDEMSKQAFAACDLIYQLGKDA